MLFCRILFFLKFCKWRSIHKNRGDLGGKQLRDCFLFWGKLEVEIFLYQLFFKILRRIATLLSQYHQVTVVDIVPDDQS